MLTQLCVHLKYGIMKKFTAAVFEQEALNSVFVLHLQLKDKALTCVIAKNVD